MKRWTNGLPGATKRLGAKMALRGLAASQPRMRADTHDGPEQIAPLQRPDTLMQLSRSLISEVHLVPHGRAIHCGTSVWTGRALQAESDDLEVIGLALLYPALERNVCVPGHHGYPRKYRRIDAGVREDFSIGCRILTQPFFFDEHDWISVPVSWSRNIVTFKTYDASEGDGAILWKAVQDRLAKSETKIVPAIPHEARYGTPILVLPRLGQGAFRY